MIEPLRTDSDTPSTAVNSPNRFDTFQAVKKGMSAEGDLGEGKSINPSVGGRDPAEQVLRQDGGEKEVDADELVKAFVMRWPHP